MCICTCMCACMCMYHDVLYMFMCMYVYMCMYIMYMYMYVCHCVLLCVYVHAVHVDVCVCVIMGLCIFMCKCESLFMCVCVCNVIWLTITKTKTPYSKALCSTFHQLFNSHKSFIFIHDNVFLTADWKIGNNLKINMNPNACISNVLFYQQYNCLSMDKEDLIPCFLGHLLE